jgi:Tol biopolymer transport system component
VDKRADIWAFGVVLYEMLTGRRLFQGETVTDTIAAVVTREPDWSALPAGTPANVRRLLDRCLRKDVKTRLRDIGEALVLLDEPEASAPAASALRARLAWMLAAAFALSTLALVVLRPRPKLSDPGPAIARFQISLVDGTTWPTNNNATQWAPSPDGSNLAMIAADLSTGKNALWVRPLGSASEHRLDKTEGANFPFWAPDGHSIGFFAENKLKRVALSGGSVQTVCEVASGADGGSWGQDGTILFAAVNGPLMRVSATGGIPRPASLLAEGETWHSWPQFLPGGRHVLCLAENKDAANNAIYVQELDSTKRVRVLNNLTRAVWSPPGYLLFVREGTLFAQRMDAKTFQVEGEARAVAQDVATNDANGRSSFAVSENGVLAYRHGAAVEMKQLTWRGHDGKAIGKVGAPGKILNPTLSPDGKNVAVLMGDVEADMDAWVLNLANGVPARLTRDAKAWLVYDVMVWSPDSQRLAISQGNGVIKVITLASEEIVPLTKENARAWDWSPDGRSILCTDIPRPRRVRLLSLTEEAKLPAIPDPPYNQTQYRFSPDGQYVVYASNESGQQEIYVASFPSFAIKRKISSGGAMFPVWPKGGGKEIFYRSNDGWMMSAEIHTGANIEASIPKPLFRFGRGRPTLNRFAVSADSGRFLIAEAVQDSDAEKLEITLVLNWAAEVKLQ